MLRVPFARRFRSRAANLRSGQRNRTARNNKAAQTFSFCVFTATRIALIAGRPQKPTCGMIAQLKSGE